MVVLANGFAHALRGISEAIPWIWQNSKEMRLSLEIG